MPKSMVYKFKVQISNFHGEMEVEDFLDWLDSLESYFDWKEVPEEIKVKLVDAKLRGPVSIWWKHYQNDREVRGGKGKIRRWDKMKEKLKAQFLPRDYEQSLYQKVQNLRQRDKTVKEYTQEFHKLLLRNSLAESEAQRVSWYVNGLWLAIQDEIGLHRFFKVSDAYQLALKVEAKLTRGATRKMGTDHRGGATSSRGGNANQRRQTTVLIRPNNQLNPTNGRGGQGRGNFQGQGTIKCYKCSEIGHRSNECLRRRGEAQVNLAKDQEEELEENSANQDDENQHEATHESNDEEEDLDADIVDLPPDKEPLDWTTRMKIAAGAAKGLEYLHDKANPPVIYRDFKSSNILLDEGYHPKLSDFGLAKLGPVGDKTHVSTRVMGTYGYCAPEYAMTGQLTLKSDVYSFGVVFLELITGRKAIDNTQAPGENNLVAWARPLFKDRRKFPKMADPLLQGRYPMRGLYQALAVAAMCLQERAATRPLIGDVVTALTYLASQTYDPNAAAAQNNRVGRGGRHGSQSPHQNSPDFRQQDPVRGMGFGAEISRGETGDGSGRKWGLDELERQESQRDSPVNGGIGRETPRNRDLDRERAVAEAKVWGENWRERKRANAMDSFDGTNEEP
ncbi:hypothetical protein HHK36_022896 [Tetracentron sinense]|uniref:Uncharacterized protein n=1 Tax=Tetracentron sinense TaxID=13715 RepID=A0A835D781_TETSI|nr:hypothetical protein HHK36_022896 [Tetracentron sinense]